MTGTSAHETMQTARRGRPAAGGTSAAKTPPVLFRLPSVTMSMPSVGLHASTGFVGPSSTVFTPTEPTTVEHLQGAVSASAASHTASDLRSPLIEAARDERKAGQRLVNAIIVALFVVVLAVISMLALRNQSGGSRLVEEHASKGTDPLAKLSGLQVPESHNASASSSASRSPNEQSAQSPSDQGQAGSLIRGIKTGHLTSAAGSASATAAVHLGAPVPLSSSASESLVDHYRSPSSSSPSELPLTTPRYETVSTPSANKSGAERSSTKETGASPSLWDGAAKKTTESEIVVSNELSLSKPAGSETTNSPEQNTSSTQQERLLPDDMQLKLSRQIESRPASDMVKPEGTDNLGVTVGGGLREPANLGEMSKPSVAATHTASTQPALSAQATATPELDTAAVIGAYVEHRAKRSAVLASKTNSSKPNIASTSTSSAGSNYSLSGTLPNAYQTQSGATGTNPSSAAGSTTLPYVRSAPGAPTDGLSSGNTSSSTSIGYSTNPQPAGAGFSIPARGSSTTTSSVVGGGSAPTVGQGQSQVQNLYKNPSLPSAAEAMTGTTSSSPSVQVSDPYAGGQAPIGLIGQSGYATAPSGDFVGGPTPVTGTVGFATSTVNGMPSGARPTAPSEQAKSSFGTMPHMR